VRESQLDFYDAMVSEEKCFRTIERCGYYVILPMLPELQEEKDFTPALQSEYSSKDKNITVPQLRELLAGSSSEIAAFL
jgi:hypothetical protein